MNGLSLLLVASGGAVGALSRYLLVLGTRAWCGNGPWPVAIVNVLGCFGFGLCWAWCGARAASLAGALLLAGFFGGFTTFSAFAFDAYGLLIERRFTVLCLDLLLQNALGIAALALGITLGGGARGPAAGG